MILIKKIYNNRELLIKALFVFAIFVVISYFYFIARSVEASFGIKKQSEVLQAEKLDYQKLEKQYIDQISGLSEDDFQELGFVSVENPIFVERHTSVARADN